MKRTTWAALAIVLVAAALRLWAVGFGLPLLLKPDENRMVEVAYSMGDARFHHWFLVYPHLLFIVEWALFMAVAATGIAFGYFQSFKAFRVWRHGRPHVLHLISRLPVVLCGVLTPLAVMALARHHGGAPAGLLAALLLAVLPMHVKESMYFSVDVPMVLCSVVALALAVETAERGRARLLWAAGVAGGLAAGCKYPAAMLAVPLTLAWGFARVRHGASFGHLVACGALMIAAFVITTPTILMQPGALVEEMRILSGRLALPHEGIELGPGWLYHPTVSMPEGFTWPVMLAGSVGLAMYGFRGTGLVLTAYLAAFYLAFARSHTVFQRYALPLAPVLCLFAARSVLRLSEHAGRGVAIAAGALLVLVPLQVSATYVELLGRPDTREVARRWFEEHVPPGTRVAMIGRAWIDIQIEKDFDMEDPWRPERHEYLRLGRTLKLDRFLPEKTYRVTYADDLAQARAAGCTYAVLGDHPWHQGMRLGAGVPEAVAAAGELVWSVDPIRPGFPPARYDQQDAWLVPTSGFASLTAPGPRLKVYRLR